MQQNPEISVVTVNYNGLELTGAMIESLARHVTTSYEVIVVDNGSRKDEASELQRRYPHAVVIRSDRNLGFAGGNNLGIRRAKGEYLLLLNNDAFVTDDSLKYLCETLRNDPGLGAVSPKIRFAAAPRHIQFAGYTPLSRITLRNRLIGFDQPDDGGYDTPHDTPYMHGAAVLVSRDAIRKAGLMPECYFLYYEELDWSVRIAESGYRLGYDPRCTVYHRESATTGSESPLRTFYLTRNRLLFGRRNRRGFACLATILYQIGIAAPKNTGVYLLKGRNDLCAAVWRGVCAFFTMKPRLHTHTDARVKDDENLRPVPDTLQTPEI